MTSSGSEVGPLSCLPNMFSPLFIPWFTIDVVVSKSPEVWIPISIFTLVLYVTLIVSYKIPRAQSSASIKCVPVYKKQSTMIVVTVIVTVQEAMENLSCSSCLCVGEVCRLRQVKRHAHSRTVINYKVIHRILCQISMLLHHLRVKQTAWGHLGLANSCVLPYGLVGWVPIVGTCWKLHEPSTNAEWRQTLTYLDACFRFCCCVFTHTLSFQPRSATPCPQEVSS